MTTYRVRGKYNVFVKTTEGISAFCNQLQEKAYNEGAVSGFFDVTQDEHGQIVVIFKRDLEEDREYAEERCPHDLRSGLMKQLHAELVEGNMPPVSLEWIEEGRKAFRVVEKKLRWCISTYEPVMANSQEEAQAAVETGCVDDAYQGSDQSQSQEVVYEITEVALPIPKRPRPCCPFCRHEGLKMGLPTWVAKSTDSAPHGFSAILHEYRCEGCDRPFFVSDDDDDLKFEEKSDASQEDARAGEEAGAGQTSSHPA